MSVKSSAPVLGFNHNFQYQGRRYHVQTEDSGLPHAHYITHLFLGGNIVASVKTSYSEKVADPDLPKLVRGLMESQHKALVKRLMAGEFNDRLEILAGSAHYEPGVLADGTNTADYTNSREPQPAQQSARPTPAAGIKPAAKPAAPPAPAAARPAAPAPVAPVAPRPAAAPSPKPPAAKPAAAPPVWQPAPPSASPVSPRQPGAPLPSVTRMPPPAPGARPVPPRMAPIAPAPAPRAAAPAPRPPAQPAARPSIFAETPAVEMPHDDLPTLFAEELISEKSLDEVILAFLSADLEPPK